MREYWWNDPQLSAKLLWEREPAKAQECIRLADEICQNKFVFRGHWEMERTHEPVFFSGTIHWDQVPFDDPEWVFAFNRHTFLVVLGQAFVLTGAAKYPEQAGRLWADWIERVPFSEEAASLTWRPIECGLRCENWLRALGLFGSALEASLRAKIEESLKAHGRWLLMSHTYFQKLSNWGVLQDHGLLLLGLAFEEPEWADTAAGWLEEELAFQVLADGSHWEQSPLYHCEVLHCCLDSLLAARAAGYRLPAGFISRTRAMALALGKMLRPDGRLFCQSDSDEVDARDLLAEAAFLFQDPVLKGYAAGRFYAENIWDFGSRYLAYQALPSLPESGSSALPDSGNYMLRDGSEAAAGMLHFHCGSLGSGHGHADLLHVDLVAGKETILADSGRGTYVEGELRKALKSPSGHNTIVVDETEFTAYRSGWSYWPIAEPLKGEYRFDKAVDYVSGAHLGYLKIGVFTRRRVIRLGRGLWLIWDDFQTVDEKMIHQYDRYFHFTERGSVTKTAGAVSFEGLAVHARMLFPGEGTVLETYPAPVSREYNRLENGTCLRARTKQSGDLGLATVIATAAKDSEIRLSAKLCPITLTATGAELSAGQGQAVQIGLNGEEWTVMMLNTEVISEVSLLKAGGKCGYGKVQVFGPPCPEGLCLGW